MIYTYNLSGAMVEQQYPSGRVVKNTLDANGDLAQVQSRTANDTFKNYVNSFTYTAVGAVSSMRLGNGRWENTTFNERLQPTMIGLGSGATSQNLLKLNYDYGTTDNNGNVKSQTITVKRPSQVDLVFDQTYTYDSLNRITSAEEKTGTTTNWMQVYTFDRYGNRNFDEANTTTITKNCGTSPNFVVCTADIPAVNPVASVSTNRLNDYTYDAAGNVITDAEGRTFTYDAENKQVEVENSLSQTVGEYFYDGDGKRIKKYVPSTGETTIFVYDAGGKLIGEYSTNVSLTPQTQYLTSDHIGTPRVNTDQLGNVVSRTDYMPYGEEIIALGGRISSDKYVTDDVRQGFTGYENDAETGLDFAQARMYSKSLAKFSSTDPILMTAMRKLNPQEINLYVYVKNNPLNYVDPTGERIEGNLEAFNNYKHYVESLSDDNPDKAGLLATINQLIDSKVTYVINVTTKIEGAGSEVEGRVAPDEKGEKIMVNIRNIGNGNEEWSLNSRFAHELTHAQQFDNGEIGFERTKDGTWSVMSLSYDSYDEVNAYKASVRIAATNGEDNTNRRLRGIITGFQDAKGDSSKELEVYKRYKKPKEVIDKSKNIDIYNKPSGLIRQTFSNGTEQFYCNRGCKK